MNKETTDSILKYVKEQTTDILGYEPNNNDLNGILLNILEDIQNRTVEYTDYITGGYDNENK